MKKRLLLMVVVAVVVGMCSSVAFALDPMGPPTDQLEKGQFGLGVDYMFSDMDLDESGDDDEDLQATKVFGTLTYGATDNVDVFVRLGIGHAAGEDVASGGSDLDWGSTEFAWGLGGKVTFLEQDRCKWGALITWSQFKSEEHSSNEEVAFDELQIAVGPTYELSDSVSVYGGPFYHHVDGDAQGPSPTDKKCLDTDGFGGYLGAQFKINENASLTTEFQYTDDAVGFAAGVMWGF